MNIGILTSGGDAPGMNAAIRGVVRTALQRGAKVTGFYRGFAGLINDECVELNHRSVSNIISRGGTILKTARSPEFMSLQGQERAVCVLKKNSVDGLVLIGGNGTFSGALALATKWNFPCVAIPATINNDINGTDSTIGADTAVNTALEAVDKIRDTATSMERVFVVEVMGRGSGFIAMQVALSAGAEDVILPEKKFDLDYICHDIINGNIRGKVSWILIVAEGAASAPDIARKITDLTSLETRVVVLGHIQRGGSPTARDRILGCRMGSEAVKQLLDGQHAKAIGIVSDNLNICDLEVMTRKKPQNTDDLYKLAKLLT